MIFKKVSIDSSLLKRLSKEGLVSIEVAKTSDVKILNKDNVENSTNKNSDLKKKKSNNKLSKITKKTITKKSKEKKKNNKVIKSVKSNERFKTIDDDHKDRTKTKIEVKKKIKKVREKKKKIKIKINKNLCEKKGNDIEPKNYDKNITEETNEENSIKEVEQKKKKIFDIEQIIKNEENFKKIKEIKYKIHCSKWNKNNELNISHNIIKSLYDHNFYSPREIQSKTLKHSINEKKDIIVVSKTGTGKTLTFCLPILSNILQNKLKEFHTKNSQINNSAKKTNKKAGQKFRCLVLVPTRELAVQILNHFNYVNKYINIYIITIIGGLNINKQLRLISKKPEIIICTPGRLKYFLQLEDKINYLYNMKNVRYFVCDEVDKMIETSFINDIHFISKHLYKCVDEKKKFIQTFLLSATLSLTVQLHNENLAKLLNYISIRKDKSYIIDLTNEKDHNQNKIAISNNNDINYNKTTFLPDHLTLNIIKCEKKIILHKLYYLLKLYILKDLPTNKENQVKKIIIFLNTIKLVKDVSTIFKYLFFEPGLESSLPNKYKTNLFLSKKINIYSIHSKQKLKERIQSISKFTESNNSSILFCTDVMSRGIDLNKCDLIIQLNCPISDITFIHRSGRTARNLKSGECICFITDDEISKWNISLKKIGLNLENLKEYENVKTIANNEFSKINKAIGYCNEILQLQNKIKSNKEKSNLSKLAKDAELSNDDDITSDSDNPFPKKTNEHIFKNLFRLKKQLYNTLYHK
ncbi:ATP-dependent RNA helicase MAK5, putative [Plasmodium berghei]|uniref:ATP-dependent RNA helicase n=2 Tax=Plasmodium berghei TaxID=5821 RepID=A0A509AN12_PLABA|nr:ATP-dependent RNA helicase MAK5, putative [Plasmodium berghei ANKA]CXI89686.1 ATP-dependent RNA helicase MAK5, putative [Plasmodium berghei]SCL96112.1 ATP-dependent RNA helicase MAK5, putative [Plasmodium berghei]SCM16366.1 ATP-dependent RNA helicase MAK5, putative [Plasmodium berghei]SCM18160.1 ATP-dependent RNA helicase MAK5, putative [Plasmodium berghei]SCN27587.1 ATP-dependent RNA helicase MAK5, putative [Plasmodium berghei]|eukprot:XP_034423243.1 ATP-dependent RNA helicase MAK5, putative [Plasmodium berghei ANKA]